MTLLFEEPIINLRLVNGKEIVPNRDFNEYKEIESIVEYYGGTIFENRTGTQNIFDIEFSFT